MTDAPGWPREAREAVARAFWQSALPPYPYECVDGDERVDLDEAVVAALAALAPFLAKQIAAARADGLRAAAAYLHGRAKALRLRDAEDRGIPDHMGHSFEANAGDAWAAAILAAAEPPA